MTKQEPMTVVISYAHEDKALSALFMREFERSFSPGVMTWKVWTDEKRPGTPIWRDFMNAELPHADAGVLLISPKMLSSGQFDREGFNALASKAQSERLLLFPVLLTPSDLNGWDDISRQQYFKPKGVHYGAPWSANLAYSELVEFDPAGSPLPHPMRQRYMTALVKALQQAILQLGVVTRKKKERETDIEVKENSIFHLIRPARELTPEDLMGAAPRARINRAVYWRRKSDDLAVEHLKQGRWIQIIGAALSGKSRTLLEAVRKLDHVSVLIPRPHFIINDEFRLPAVNTPRTLVILDDIEHIMAAASPQQLTLLLAKLYEAGAMVAASCRRGSELRTFESLIPASIRQHFEKIFINRMTEMQLASFKSFYAKKADDGGGCKPDEKVFDGNIGSLFMNFTAVGAHYANLRQRISQHAEIPTPPELPAQILKALKYFYYAENIEGKNCFSAAKIKDFCERSLLGKRTQTAQDPKPKPRVKENASPWQKQLSQFESLHARDEFSANDWKNALLLLSHPDYDLNLIRVSGDHICAESAYLERLIERAMRPEHLLSALKNAYRNENLLQKGFFSSIFGATKLINLTRSADEALKLLQRLEPFGFKTNAISFNSVINKSESFNECLTLFNKARQFDIRPDEVTLNSLVYKAETFDQALLALNKFKENGLIPDDAAFTSLLGKAVQFNQRIACLDILHEAGKKVGEKVFSDFITEAASFDEAAAYLDKMREHRCRPKETLLGLVITRAENFSQSQTYLDKLESFNLTPDEITFTSLINKTDTLEQAMTIVERMERVGLTPNVINFTALLGKTSDFREVLDVLRRMREKDVHPNKITANLLTKKVRQSPRHAMETLFAERTPEEVFSDFNLNRLAGEAVKAEPALLSFITPHIAVIGGQKDMTITYYARILEYNNAAESALQLLGYIKSDTYESFNIRANCLKNSHFGDSLENYRKALAATRENTQKAIVLNNAAQLIFEHKKSELFDEAMDMCRQALQLRTYQEFPYPAELLLLLTVYSTPEEQTENRLRELLGVLQLDLKVLTKIADQVEDPAQKDIVKRMTETPQA